MRTTLENIRKDTIIKSLEITSQVEQAFDEIVILFDQSHYSKDYIIKKKFKGNVNTIGVISFFKGDTFVFDFKIDLKTLLECDFAEVLAIFEKLPTEMNPETDLTMFTTM